MELLAADPRSVYRKQKCQDQSYRVTLDGLEATCRFDPVANESPGGEGATPREEPSQVATILAVRRAAIEDHEARMNAKDDVDNV